MRGQGKNLEAETEMEAPDNSDYCLVSSKLLSYFSYTAQAHLHRDDTATVG